MLEYDNSAFYYFTLTLSTFLLAPVTLFTLAQVWTAVVPPNDPKLQGRTEAELTKSRQLKKETTGVAVLLRSWTFNAKIVGLVIGWSLFYLLVTSMSEDAEIASFDPYAILGIARGVEDKAIKSAYRKLSLQYHPDKNPGNKMAEDMFMKIAKAYEALTDAQSKENWEKYGNPDGKQPMEVSIALPTFLLNKEWHNTILILYLLAMVIIIPSIVAMWYARSKKYGEKNVMYDSYAWYNHMLNDNTPMKGMPEVLAGSAEFRSINAPTMRKMAEVVSLRKAFLKEDGALSKFRYDHPIIVRGALQLYAHCYRRELSPALREDLKAMLAQAPDLIEAMIELSCSRRWLSTTLTVISFSQLVVQGLWTRDNPLLQFPHITDKDAKEALGKGGAKSIAAFLKQPDSEKKGLARLTDAEKDEVFRVAKLLPDVDISVDVFVEDEEQIAENDLVTIKVTLTRNNVPEGKNAKAPPVYAPYFPVPLEEGWWVLVGSVRGDQIFSYEKIAEQGHVVEKEVKMLAPNKAGTVTLDVFIVSDCYIGLNQQKSVSFKVVEAGSLPVYVPHPDDLELDNEPTLFEQVMAGYDEETDSDEEQEEGEKGDKEGEGEGGKAAANGEGEEAAATDGHTTNDAADDDDRESDEED